jgi:Ti-type conjugative transfer relaxase TraA
MLSISARHAAAGGIRAYLEGERDGANHGVEDYYAEAGHAPGRWLGSGAEALGLAGNVEPRAFDHLAAGFHPKTGEALVQRAGEAHRSGWDLTFSAPKSVSIVWGLAEREQREAIEHAHVHAVERTLALAEREGLFVTRRGQDGVERETARPVIATYVHGTSREADPQLHTHAFVMNVAARHDGSHGTLETKPLYAWKMALGAAYRAEFAQELRSLGYAVEADSKNTFRLSEMSRDAERHFSKRRVQIEAKMAERGTSGARAAEVAALDTRKPKEAVTAATLREQWREEALAYGVTAERLADLSRHAEPEHSMVATQTVIDHLHHQQSTFTRADIARAAAEQVQIAGGGLARTEALARDVVKDAEIVPLAGERYTTREMLEIERGALNRAQQMAHEATYPVEAAAIKDRSLSDEQRAALAHVVAPSRLCVLEGLAGTGKSHVLGAARETWEASGYEVRAAALAGKAASGLEASSGIHSQTLHSLLRDVEKGRDQLTERTVLVVDEAGMVGSRQFARLLDEADRAQAKLVLVGDANQLQPIEAGQLFERISNEVGHARLTEIQRQRDIEDRAVVQALAVGDARTALESLEARGRLHALPNHEQAAQQLVHDWSATRDAGRPGDDVMLGATRADTAELNRLARDVLRERGELQHERVIEATQGPLVLAEGDRIVITRNAKVLGMTNGELATVTALSERRGEIEITARFDAGHTRTWGVSEHPHVEHGYALTVHKAQGVSVERSYVLAHESMSAREWSYVAGSRAREAVHLYADRHTAKDLEQIMGRSQKKDIALDHQPAAAKAEVGLER